MRNGIWKVLQRADGDLFFRQSRPGVIRFREVRDDGLEVTVGSQCARLEKRLLEVDAPLVRVNSCQRDA